MLPLHCYYGRGISIFSSGLIIGAIFIIDSSLLSPRPGCSSYFSCSAEAAEELIQSRSSCRSIHGCMGQMYGVRKAWMFSISKEIMKSTSCIRWIKWPPLPLCFFCFVFSTAIRQSSGVGIEAADNLLLTVSGYRPVNIPRNIWQQLLSSTPG